MSNAELRKRTGMAKLEKIVKKKKTQMARHVITMEDSRISNQALNWNISSMNKKPRRSGKNWQDII